MCDLDAYVPLMATTSACFWHNPCTMVCQVDWDVAFSLTTHDAVCRRLAHANTLA